MSASESNSRPSTACLRRHRARRPSSASKTKKRLRFDLNSCRPRPAKAGKARSTHISTPRAGLLRSAWGSLASINTLASQCSGTWKTTRPFYRPPAANQLRRSLSQIPMYVEPVVRTRRTILCRANQNEIGGVLLSGRTSFRTIPLAALQYSTVSVFSATKSELIEGIATMVRLHDLVS
jgi:hypothetical protein